MIKLLIVIFVLAGTVWWYKTRRPEIATATLLLLGLLSAIRTIEIGVVFWSRDVAPIAATSLLLYLLWVALDKIDRQIEKRKKGAC